MTRPTNVQYPSLIALAFAASIAAGSPSHALTNHMPAPSTIPAGTLVRTPNFDVQPVGDSVYAVIRREPQGLAVNSNSLLVICDSDVVVVDAQFTRAATAEVIGALRKLTSKPVRYVVNTHWHDDHVAGNQVYRDSFPDVEFIAHANMREDLRTLGADNRKGTVAAGPGVLADFQRLMDKNLALDSTPISPSERAAITSTIAIAKQYIAEAPGFRETLPTITFTDQLTLHRGSRRIEIHYLGRANTRGDAVVYLPDQHILASGDLLVAPIPFAFGSYIGEWIVALDKLDALHPAVIVPGHGPVMRDASYLRLVSSMLSAVRDQTTAAEHAGASLADTRKRVTLANYRQQVAGTDKWLNYTFDRFFLAPAVERAYTEARESSKRG